MPTSDTGWWTAVRRRLSANTSSSPAGRSLPRSTIITLQVRLEVGRMGREGMRASGSEGYVGQGEY
jgi:hypothetical protein